MKQNRHSLMAKGIMVLLSLLVLIFALTYSWFTPQRNTVEASGLSITSLDSVEFDVAVAFKNTSTRGEYLVSDFRKTFDSLSAVQKTVAGQAETYDLLYDYSPVDVTGNGSLLYIPVLTDEDMGRTGRRKINEEQTRYTTVDENVEYLSFDMIFRCDQSCNVYLDSGSEVLALCEEGGGSLVGSGVDRKSDYGNFSKDAVVGAMRIGFVNYEDGYVYNQGDSSTNNLTVANIVQDTEEYLRGAANFIWLPRPDIYLEDDYNETTGVKSGADWTLHTDAESGFYTTYDDTTTHYYWKIVNDTAAQASDIRTVTDPRSEPIAHIGTYDATNSCYYGKVRVNIWIEGTDAEARRAIAGGMFKVNFDLRAG